MKILALIAGILLALMFVAGDIVYFFKLYAPPAPPAGSPMAMFMGAFYPTGYLDLVKALELVGAVLIAIPRTRRLGLLVLGPIIINIILFHLLVAKEGLATLLPIVVLTLFLTWVERRAFANFIAGR
jgi:putative oxidoreductase